jgi:hypothetical protein
MATKEVRPETVKVTEEAAWAQIQKLQKTVFERGGLAGVMQFNTFLSRRYRELTSESEKQGKNELLSRGITSAIFLTDLLPDVEEKMAGTAVDHSVSPGPHALSGLPDWLVEGLAG